MSVNTIDKPKTISVFNKYNGEMDFDKMVEGCRKGNRKAQAALFKEYSPRFMGLCIRYSGNENDAQDMMQNGFISIFNSFKNFKSTGGNNEGKLVNWMKRIFINTYVWALEEHKESPTDYTTDDYKHPSTDSSGDDETWLMTERHGILKAEEVHDALNTLTDRERVIFNMKVMDGYSLKEIASEMEMKYPNVASGDFQARKKLRRYFRSIDLHRQLKKYKTK